MTDYIDREALIESLKDRYCVKPNKQYQPPYCPHCGAKMDEEGKNV